MNARDYGLFWNSRLSEAVVLNAQSTPPVKWRFYGLTVGRWALGVVRSFKAVA